MLPNWFLLSSCGGGVGIVVIFSILLVTSIIESVTMLNSVSHIKMLSHFLCWPIDPSPFVGFLILPRRGQGITEEGIKIAYLSSIKFSPTAHPRLESRKINISLFDKGDCQGLRIFWYTKNSNLNTS